MNFLLFFSYFHFTKNDLDYYISLGKTIHPVIRRIPTRLHQLKDGARLFAPVLLLVTLQEKQQHWTRTHVQRAEKSCAPLHGLIYCNFKDYNDRHSKMLPWLLPGNISGASLEVGVEGDEDNVVFYWDNKGPGSIVPIPLTLYYHGGSVLPLSQWNEN